MSDLLSKAIKKIRLDAGDTPGAAAEKVGVSRQAFVKWEEGDTKNMKLGNFLKFCDCYGVSIETILRATVGNASHSSDERTISSLSEDGGYLLAPSMQPKKFMVAEPDPEISMLIKGYQVADDGIKRAIMTLARESIVNFEMRSEKNN